MMTRAVLQRIAGREGVGLAVLEKDYVLTEALRALAQVPLMATTFVFKGGTALRKVYFPQWRYSEDLDFTVTAGFPQESLEAQLEELYRVVRETSGITLATREMHRPNGFARLRIQFRALLEQPGTLFVDLTFDEPVLVPPVRRDLLTAPFESPPAAVLAYVLEELMAEKLRSILERGKSRDYYDVWRVLREHRRLLDAEKMRDLYVRKCAHKGLSDNGIEQLMAADRLAAAERYWDTDLAMQIGDLPSFRDVTRELGKFLAGIL